MTGEEAIFRVKTGKFNNNFGFDMQILIDAVGTLGEMFRSGQIIECVRCENCKHSCDYTDIYPDNAYKCTKNGGYHNDSWFCADGEV